MSEAAPNLLPVREADAVCAAEAARIASRFCLDGMQAAQVAALLAGLALDPHAPTTLREPQVAADRHLADSLSALEFEPVHAARRVADIGSGTGFPGLALAVALPGAAVALVESARRRCAFIERTIAGAGVANARAVCARAEDWPAGLASHQLVTARAVATQAVVLEYAAPLLEVGGALVDWRGRRSSEDEEGARRAAAILGLELVEIRSVQPFSAAIHRHLHLYLKVRATPERFPRRSGMAAKRPL